MFAGLMALASCTKDWTCDCKTTLNIGSTSTTTKGSYVIKDTERKDAKNQCKSLNVESNAITTKCNLK